MNTIKLILIAVGLVTVILLAFSVTGLISSALWLLFWLGIIAIAGLAGYKLLKTGGAAQSLEEKKTVTLADLENTDRTLEEYKRKYLSE